MAKTPDGGKGGVVLPTTMKPEVSSSPDGKKEAPKGTIKFGTRVNPV
jgi:hypothetical protein